MINKTKKILLASLASSLILTNSNADFIGAEAGYALWAPSLSGYIQKDGDNVNLENDLGFGSTKANSFFWAYLDHPIPLLPNIKIQQTNYTDIANGKLTKQIKFSGIDLIDTNLPLFGGGASISDNTKSEFTLNQLDLIAYWRILDNWVNLDLGINIKKIDGNIKIDTETSDKHVNEDFSTAVPMLYGKARFDLPFSGLSAEADMSYISYDGNKISDMKAGLSYNFIAGLSAVVGVRNENLTIKDVDGIDANIDINGYYAGVSYHF